MNESVRTLTHISHLSPLATQSLSAPVAVLPCCRVAVLPCCRVAVAGGTHEFEDGVCQLCGVEGFADVEDVRSRPYSINLH